MDYRGAIFDVDWVLVGPPHERAWRETQQLLIETDWRDIELRTTYAPERFTPAVYQEVVAGKPRMSGTRAVFDYFGVPAAVLLRRVGADLDVTTLEDVDLGAVQADGRLEEGFS